MRCTVDTKTLYRALRAVTRFSPKDPGRPHLRNIFIEIGRADFTSLVVVDGWALAHAQIPQASDGASEPGAVLLPAGDGEEHETLITALKNTEEPNTTIQFLDGVLTFPPALATVSFTPTHLPEAFPDWKSILGNSPGNNPFSSVDVQPDQLLKAARAAADFHKSTKKNPAPNFELRVGAPTEPLDLQYTSPLSGGGILRLLLMPSVPTR